MTRKEEGAKKKDLMISVSPDEIMGSEIYRNKDYRYASVGIKRGDNEFIRIAYEWKGENVPDFVLGVMSWIKANKEEIASQSKEYKEELAQFVERLCKADINNTIK